MCGLKNAITVSVPPTAPVLATSTGSVSAVSMLAGAVEALMLKRV